MLHLARLSLRRVEDDGHADEVDHDEQRDCGTHKRFGRVLSSGQSDAQQELENPHQAEDGKDLVPRQSPRLLRHRLASKETEHAHNCCNQHDLCRQAQRLRRAAQLRVV